jgi:hypothetical protein
MRKKYYEYDEAFKELMKEYFEPFARVITDYELLTIPKRVDLLIIELEKPIINYVKIFSYFKRYNIIEFKSEKDRFIFWKDLYNIGIYLNGVLLKEKVKNYDNSTFSLVTTLKPKKLLDTFKAKELRKGIYTINNISIIPINIVVIEELEINYEKETEILKEFTSLKDRRDF